MDPITPIATLALVCNITQLIAQAVDAIRCCKELWHQGSLDKNNLVERCAGNLVEANSALDLAIRSQPVAGRAAKIQTLAEDAVDTAKQLKVELNKVKLSKAQGVRTGENFKRALKTFIKGGSIRRLEDRLERQERTLNSTLLKDLYIKCGQGDLTRRDEFQKLSQRQQDIISQVLHAQKLLSADIVASIKSSEADVTSHLDRQDVQLANSLQLLSTEVPGAIKQSEAIVVQRLDAQDAHFEPEAAAQQGASAQWRHQEEQDVLRRRLLDALAFPEMNERRNMIESRVADFGPTYAWIFGCDKTLQSSGMGYLDFFQWLQSDEDVFWISGKPGSGKSTLMDFVFHNLRKGGLGCDALQAWAGTMKVQLLSLWFFRSATSVLLKSMQGFWRSLCFQVLDLDKTILETIRNNTDGAAPELLRSCVLANGSRAQSWTDKELRAWLQYLLGHSSFKYCILADGLDELESSREQLLETIIFLASAFTNVKVVCSSRPEMPFEGVLQSYSSLRVQEFNYQDIESACQRRLEDTGAQSLAKEVAKRAEGVFLWAHIIAEDLRLAAHTGDDEEELWRRLNECPAEMSELFEHLLQRQDRFYTRNPKPYLRLIEFACAYNMADLTLLEVLIASQPQQQHDLLFYTRNWHEYALELDDCAANFETKIVARCAGLVEVPSWRYVHTDYKIDNKTTSFPAEFALANLISLDNAPVQFIHRSVLDFLQDGPKASSMPLLCALSDDEVKARLFNARFIRFFLNPDETSIGVLLGYARGLAVADWTSRLTQRLDMLFSELGNRIQHKQKAPNTIVDYLYREGLTVTARTAPQLSSQDNLTFAMAAVYHLDPYIRSKMRNLDTDQLAVVLAVFHCNALGMCVEVAELLAPSIDTPMNTMLMISLEYPVGRTTDQLSTITSSRYLWEHLAIACPAAVPDPYLPGRIFRLLRKIKAVEEDQVGDVEGLLIGDGSGLHIVPMPDDWCDDQLQQWHPEWLVFHIRLVLRAARRGPEDRYTVPRFLRLRIAGTARFLDLSDTQSDELHQAWSTTRWVFAIVSWYQHNLAELWNRCLAQVPPQETSQLLCCNENRFLGHQVFKNGRLQEADSEEWVEWRFGLRRNRHTETDPVLVGYVNLMDERKRMGRDEMW